MERHRRGNASISVAFVIVVVLIVVGASAEYGRYHSVSNANPNSDTVASSTVTSGPSSSPNCGSQPFGCDESSTVVTCPTITTNATIVMTASSTTITYMTTATTYSCAA